MNPLIAILYFALSVYLLIKGHSIFSAVLSVLLYGILFYMNNKGNSVAMDQDNFGVLCNGSPPVILPGVSHFVCLAHKKIKTRN